MTRRRRSRLTTIERKRTVKAVVWALALVAIIGAALFYYGIPLLVRMAVFMASVKNTDSVEVETSAFISSPTLDALPEATPSASIQVSGFTLPDTSVVIVVNGRESDPVVPREDGSFSAPITLVDGDNVIVAIAKDSRDNSSPSSRHWTVVRDSSPPTLTITEPQDGSKRSGVSEKKVDVEGQTEKDVQVTVNGRFISVSSDDTFLWPMDLKEGENTIEVVASDRAGNKTLAQITITWTP